MGHRARQNLIVKGFSRQQIDRLLSSQQKNRDISRTQGFKIKRDAGIRLSKFDRQQEQRIKLEQRFLNQSKQPITTVSLKEPLQSSRENYEAMIKNLEIRQQINEMNADNIQNWMLRGDIARKQVIPITNVTRSEEIKPRNIPFFTKGLNRLRGVFNF